MKKHCDFTKDNIKPDMFGKARIDKDLSPDFKTGDIAYFHVLPNTNRIYIFKYVFEQPSERSRVVSILIFTQDLEDFHELTIVK